MNHLARTGADPVPLDFNTPSPTDRVADASKERTSLLDDSHPPAFDTESLLVEIGLSDLAIREALSSSSVSDR